MNLENEARFSKKCVFPHGGMMVTREEEWVQAQNSCNFNILHNFTIFDSI
jgi:hypothetical protein